MGGAHSGSIYAVEAVDDSLCITGGADGRLAAYDLRVALCALTEPETASPTSLANAARGRPLFVRDRAHGIRAVNKLVHADPPLSIVGSDAAIIRKMTHLRLHTMRRLIAAVPWATLWCTTRHPAAPRRRAASNLYVQRP